MVHSETTAESIRSLESEAVMRRLSVRRRDVGFFEVGPAGHGPTVSVRASNRSVALQLGKEKLRERGKLQTAAEATYRDNPRICTRPEPEEAVTA